MTRADRAAPTFTETARREQIVRSAVAVVNERGYHEASLAAIAAHAGLAKSALVYYFGSRESLLLHVISEVFGALEVSVEAAVAAHSTPEARLRAHVEGYLAHVDAHRAEVAAGVAIVVVHRAPDGVPLHMSLEPEGESALTRVLREAMDAGVVRAMPPALARSLVEHLLDAAVTEVQRDPAADLDPLRGAITETLLRGLRP